MIALSGIKGQERAVSVLSRAAARKRVAHAYLFEGIEGCGKKTTALAFAAGLFCGAPNPCGTCPSCRKMLKLQHPDLHMVEPDGQFIKIDQVRELQRELSYRPVEAPLKVAVIEAAERMNPAAGNALLKTLEEPPGNSVLILLSENAPGMLPTVLSRCQRLAFSPLPSEALQEILIDEGFEPEAARYAAVMAGGSLAKAREAVSEAGGARRRDLLEEVTAVSVREIASLFSLAEKLGKDRETATEALDLLKGLFRDILFLGRGVPEIVNDDLRPLLEREAERRSPEETAEILEFIIRGEQAVRRNVNPRLTMENLFLKLAH
jgi:DNA polymerase III subunit delta'